MASGVNPTRAAGGASALGGQAAARAAIEDQRPCFRQQVTRAERLPHVRVRARREGLRRLAILRERREDQDREPILASPRAEPAGDLVAVDAGHHQVENREVDVSLGGDPERLLAVPGLRDFVAVTLERQRDELEDVRIVVGHQDERSDRHAATSSSAACASRTGSRTRIVVPRPDALSTSTVPSCRSTIAFTIVKPRPVPGIARSVASLLRKNRSKRSSCSSGTIPIPLSATSISASLAVDESRTSTAPPSVVNLIALETRLSSTGPSRPRSPTMFDVVSSEARSWMPFSSAIGFAASTDSDTTSSSRTSPSSSVSLPASTCARKRRSPTRCMRRFEFRSTTERNRLWSSDS